MVRRLSTPRGCRFREPPEKVHRSLDLDLCFPTGTEVLRVLFSQTTQEVVSQGWKTEGCDPVPLCFDLLPRRIDAYGSDT